MKKIIVSLLSLLLILFVFLPKGEAKAELDRIKSYEIIVNPRDDGTLDMEYHIKWEVLRLDADGNGVTWVYIGTANKYVDQIEALSSSIESIKYKAEYTSSSIRCDLDKEYMPGEIIDIHYRFHQKRMFTFMENKTTGLELTTFKFIPGWFDDIEVENFTLKWNKSNVYYNDAKDEDSNYLIWSAHLKAGEKTEVNVSYETTTFPNIDRTQTYKGRRDNAEIRNLTIVIIGVVIVITIAYYIGRLTTKPSYYRTRGFMPHYGYRLFRPYFYGVDKKGTRTTNPYTVSSGGSGHSGHSCACACACACAGGGRAGCSKKDFYKGKIDIDKFIEK